jgi:2'-5' RNA ligase
MRVFVGVPIPERIREELNRIVASLRSSGNAFRWVHSAKYHVTLVFLGEQPDTAVDEMAKRLDEVPVGLPPFPVTISGIGQFPKRGKARVVFAGIREGRAALGQLHRRVIEATAGLSEVERRPYSPHVTLGRAGRRPVHLDTSCIDDGFRQRYVADRIVLYQSVLGAGPSAYGELKVYPLSPRSPDPPHA